MLEAGARSVGTNEEHRGGTGPRAGRDPVALVGAMLLFAAGVLSVPALFPAYFQSGTALADNADQIVATILVAVAWLVAAGLMAAGATPRRARLLQAGAMGAVGVAVPVAGLRMADLGQLGGGNPGGGLWLLTAAVGAGALGAAAGLLAAGRAGVLWAPGRRSSGSTRKGDWVVMGAIAVAGVVLAVAFMPSWDRYLVTTAADPRVFISRTVGDAFQNPGLAIAGNVVVAVALGLIPVVALLWRPVRGGAALGAGVLAVAAAQVVSAVTQTLERPTLAQALSPIEMQTFIPLGPTVSLHLTGWFDAEAAAVLALVVLGALRAAMARGWDTPGDPSLLPVHSPWGGHPPSGGPTGWGGAPALEGERSFDGEPRGPGSEAVLPAPNPWGQAPQDPSAADEGSQR